MASCPGDGGCVWVPCLKVPKNDVDQGNHDERQPKNCQDTFPPRPKVGMTETVRPLPRGEARSPLAAFKVATGLEFFLIGRFHASNMALPCGRPKGGA